jgi:alpha-tubulin suppressor-like RCC1 family protein
LPARSEIGVVNACGWLGGRDTTRKANPPDAVNGVSGTATDIAAGNFHSCAIQTDTGNVVCWGRNTDGQATPSDTVNGVAGTATVIAAGENHTLALPEPTAWLAQLAGLALLCALQCSRIRKRRGQTDLIDGRYPAMDLQLHH